MKITPIELSAALMRERELWSAVVNADLDIRLAEREGGDIDAAKTAKADASAAWWEQRQKNKADVRTALADAGFDAEAVKSALS